MRTLLAVIGDVAHPNWRASAVGVYRPWRDGGFAIGALVAGLLGLSAAIWAVAALTAMSGLVVALRMYETRPPFCPGRGCSPRPGQSGPHLQRMLYLTEPRLSLG